MSDRTTRTTLTLSRETLDSAQALGLDLSAIADAAIAEAVRAARRGAWAERHAAALKAQDDWMDQRGHPFADAILSPLARDGGA